MVLQLQRLFLQRVDGENLVTLNETKREEDEYKTVILVSYNVCR